MNSSDTSLSAPVQLVWLKRDLRLADHRPLVEASRQGPVVCLYVYEPELLHAPEFDASHLSFINQSLAALQAVLQARGGVLLTAVGEATEVLDRLQGQLGFSALWSHEETGNHLTYQRDLRLADWARQRGVAWHEFPQNGVVRRLKGRDGWARLWEQRMQPAPLPPPESLVAPEGWASLPTAGLCTADALGVRPRSGQFQPGGEPAAWETLHSFLTQRGQPYQRAMSSPVSAWEGCSRLSPYLSWGNLSIRQVVHATRGQRFTLAEQTQREGPDPGRRQWQASLHSFEKRLHWHCHFMQKLEDEPAIEFENINRAFDGMREAEFRPDYFEAWCAGQTGYPLIDACMRCLHETGWINFRMRAMLASFAAYHLWLHWREPAVFLSRFFLDFEPGIHFSQFQMQSGVTGINTVRIYSPIKQAQEQDPTGAFIRQYVPELAGVPAPYIHQPETMPPLLALDAGFRPGVDYPLPVVDHATAYRQAKDRVFAWKKRPEVRAAAAKVLERHGSRRRGA